MPEELKIGQKLNEGKTKIVYDVDGHPEWALIKSKDRITAGNNKRSNEMEGKAAISNKTTLLVFEYLTKAGVRTHLVRPHGEDGLIAEKCQMIPIEWVTRRVATGSFLKRNTGVQEGYRFSPPKLETFYKDDANDDPQWSMEQVVASKFNFNGLLIESDEYAIMAKSTVVIFEILEKAWASLNVALVDMKIEFGVNLKGEIVLADVIDSDSWRLWPSGDKRLMVDKQVYRDMKDVTNEGLETVKKNFQWVASKIEEFNQKPVGRAVVLMGSATDLDHCHQIQKACQSYGVPCELRVTSAHKGTDTTMQILYDYEAAAIPTVFIAVAGRSNGLGPVASGNVCWPVINCPPVKPDWGREDVWSSLRLPSGLGCTTVLSPDAAAQHAAQILAMSDHMIWAKQRAGQLKNWIGLIHSDKKIRNA